jgi:hypothetical protein
VSQRFLVNLRSDIRAEVLALALSKSILLVPCNLYLADYLPRGS